jgi:hypothetical protein
MAIDVGSTVPRRASLARTDHEIVRLPGTTSRVSASRSQYFANSKNRTDLEDTDVSHCSSRSRRAGQPECPGTSLRAADSARGIGRCRSFGGQRRTIWSRQSQVALGPQRHRQCLDRASAPQQLSGLYEHSGANAAFPFTRRRAALCRGHTAAHHCACHGTKKQVTLAPATSPRGQLVHGDLPGMLERWLLSSPVYPI